MKLEVTHLASGVRSEVVKESCCDTMLEVRGNEAVTNNNDFVEAFSNDYSPFNIFKYDENGVALKFYSIQYCPFCGQQITIDFIDGRSAPQD